jgi:beta-lactamase regulating signal transducer with metallopeptidase domain
MSTISLLESLALSIVSTFILLGLAWLSFRWIRQPADRILVIQLGIAASCLLPVVALSPWTWYRIPIRTTPAQTTSVNSSTGDSARQPDANVASTPLAISEERSPATPTSTVVPPSSVISGPIIPIPARTPADWGSVLTGCVFLLYLGAGIYTLIESQIGRIALRRFKQSAQPGHQQIAAVWQKLTRGLSPRVQILVTNRLDSPIVFGLRQPTILLPGHLANSSDDKLLLCLAHEWSHILRQDLLTSRLVWIAQVCFWFQPAYWSLRRELRLCQDQLADDFAASTGCNPIRYSELLLEFAKRQHQHSLTGSLALAHNTTHLTRRMTMLLEPEFTTRQKPRRTFLTLSICLTTFLSLVLAGIRVNASPQAETTPAAPPAAADSQPVEAVSYTCDVVDKVTGQPISNANIVVRRSKLMNTSNDIIEETKHTTDAQGKYSFTIPPEQLKEKYLYIELDVDHKNYAAKKGFGYAMSMIQKNEKLGERPFFERTELLPADTISGTVLTPEGKPAADVKILGFSMPDRRDFNSMSFTETKTEADGQFHLNVIKDASSVYWVLPRNFASIERFIDKDRKAQGTITLEAGVRSGGVVVDAAGKPLANVAVNIRTIDGNTGGLPVTSSLSRGAVTDSEGRFAFLPLPVGNYRLEVSEFRSEPTQEDNTRYKIPDVFSAQDVTLAKDTTTTSFKIQAVPTVTFSAQYLDSKGKPTSGHSIHLWGELNGVWYNDRAAPDREGKISKKIPKGIKDLRVELSTNEHGTLRYRLTPDQPLQNRKLSGIDFGTANEDISGLEIIRYKAPIVLISSVDLNGKTVNGAYVTAKYAWENNQPYILKGDHRSDMNIEHQQDGRFRTSQMLPDEDVTFTVGAEGYEPQTIAPVNLKEGEVKEVTVTLQPAKK